MELILLCVIGATSCCSLLLSLYQITRGPRVIYIVSEPEPEPPPAPRWSLRAPLLLLVPLLLLLALVAFQVLSAVD
jgi:hypothetical protein